MLAAVVVVVVVMLVVLVVTMRHVVEANLVQRGQTVAEFAQIRLLLLLPDLGHDGRVIVAVAAARLTEPRGVADQLQPLLLLVVEVCLNHLAAQIHVGARMLDAGRSAVALGVTLMMVAVILAMVAVSFVLLQPLERRSRCVGAHTVKGVIYATTCNDSAATEPPRVSTRNGLLEIELAVLMFCPSVLPALMSARNNSNERTRNTQTRKSLNVYVADHQN